MDIKLNVFIKDLNGTQYRIMETDKGFIIESIFRAYNFHINNLEPMIFILHVDDQFMRDSDHVKIRFLGTFDKAVDVLGSIIETINDKKQNQDNIKDYNKFQYSYVA